MIPISKLSTALAAQYPDATPADVTAANFPACVAAWLADYGVSGGTWTDVIGGLVITRNSSADMVKNANGTVTTGPCNNSPPAAATLLPGTDTVMLLHVGSYFTSALVNVVGVPQVNDGFEMRRDTNAYYTDSNHAANYHTVSLARGTPATIGEDGGVGGVVSGLIIDFSGHARTNTTNNGLSVGLMFEHDGTDFLTSLKSQGVGTGDQSAGIDSVTTDEALMSVGGQQHHGIYVLHFSTFPANWMDAVAWMQANPTKGLYPGFQGLT